MILANRQLDLSKMCIDLHIQPNLNNEKACALGHSLIEYITPTSDPNVFLIALTAGTAKKCRVILHENPYGWERGSDKAGKDFGSPSDTRLHAYTPPQTLTACSCDGWQTHHRDLFGLNPMSSAWICPHGASVLLSLGRSDTYLDFVSLPKVPPPVKPVEMDFSLDRRRFFAAFGKKYLYRWTLLGIDLEMAKKAYRVRFGVNSLSKLLQCEWAIAAANMQAAVQSELIMINKAADIKALLLRTSGEVV